RAFPVFDAILQAGEADATSNRAWTLVASYHFNSCNRRATSPAFALILKRNGLTPKHRHVVRG
ncbi:MAG: hypothetical protein ABSE90_06505, partial [Verrucomicrobiota bacterium]